MKMVKNMSKLRPFTNRTVIGKWSLPPPPTPSPREEAWRLAGRVFIYKSGKLPIIRFSGRMLLQSPSTWSRHYLCRERESRRGREQVPNDFWKGSEGTVTKVRFLKKSEKTSDKQKVLGKSSEKTVVDPPIWRSKHLVNERFSRNFYRYQGLF